jgi:hypothetical protein
MTRERLEWPLKKDKKEPDFPALLGELRDRFYQREEFYQLASKYGYPPDLAGWMSARGEIIELLGWRYYAKIDFFNEFFPELERKKPEEIERMLRDKGIAGEDLPEMMSFFRGYLGRIETESSLSTTEG